MVVGNLLEQSQSLYHRIRLSWAAQSRRKQPDVIEIAMACRC